MMAILTVVKWYFTEVLICTSLTISDVDHLSMCWLPIYVFSWRNVYLGLLPFFFLKFCTLFYWYWDPWAVCVFWRLILCQLRHLWILSPILKVVSVPCLWFVYGFLYCAKVFNLHFKETRHTFIIRGFFAITVTNILYFQ